VPPKRWYPPTSQHGLTTQKTIIDIFTTVSVSDILIFLQIFGKSRVRTMSII
jgi:hypothetical protein